MTAKPSGSQPAREGRFLAAATAIVAVALGLRLYRLGFQELWMDEAFSFEMATIDHFHEALRREYNPPFYYLLQRLWLRPFGESEAALRSLSALFGTAFVAALIWAGRELLDSASALWAGALATLAPLHVYYSQEARPYALLTLAILLAAIALWRALRTETRRSWAAYSACVLLCLATHYFALLALVPGALLVLLWPSTPSRRQWSRYVSATLLGLAPWLLWLAWSFWIHPHPRGGHSWIHRIWEATPPSQAIAKSLEVLAVGSQSGLLPGFFKQFGHLEFPPSLRLLGLSTLVVLGLCALLPWGERQIRIPWLRRRKAWLCALVFFPLVALWLLSQWKPYYVVGRYDLVALPAYLLLLGFAFAKIQRWGPMGAFAACFGALLLLTVLGTKLLLYYRASAQPIGPSARATARVLDARLGDGDLVVFTPWRGMPVNYYLRRLGYRRRAGSCENPATGRAFFCTTPAFDDATVVLDFDHARRVAFSLEMVRADLRGVLEKLDPARNAVWVERRLGPPHWLSVHYMLSSELERFGFRPVPPPGPLRGLRMQVYRSAEPKR